MPKYKKLQVLGYSSEFKENTKGNVVLVRSRNNFSFSFPYCLVILLTGLESEELNFIQNNPVLFENSTLYPSQEFAKHCVLYIYIYICMPLATKKNVAG
jgi:hypothetical protein